MLSVNSAYDPYKVMHDFYQKDNPSEDEQFQFVEAMEYLIKIAVSPDDIIAFSYNLAMYYRDIRNFTLEKKYLELGLEYESEFGKDQLGFIWYFGLDGRLDYEKAFALFHDSDSRIAKYMLADMYHKGQFVECDDDQCRDILEDLYERVEVEIQDDRFLSSTLYPEIAVRLADLNIFEGKDTEDDLEHLFTAREILTVRQMCRPFWGNIETMKYILETTALMAGKDYDFLDLYELLTLDIVKGAVLFTYKNKDYKIRIFPNESEVVYEFGDRWFHGAEDFLARACIDEQRITTIIPLASNIQVVSENEK